MKTVTAPDFEKLLPQHTNEELAQLTANVLADPDHERMPPILVWGNHHNTVIDGHHQLAIRQKHRLKIKYAKLNFETRDEAMRHALDVQFGRRNLSASVRVMAYAKLRGCPNLDTPKLSSDNDLENSNVRALAAMAGVSRGTSAHATKVTTKGTNALVAAVESGQVKVSDAAAVVDLPKTQQAAALKKVQRGEVKTLKAAVPMKEVDFDPAKIEREAAKRSGKEVTPAKLRKEALRILGMMVRILDKMKLGADADPHLKAINKLIKEA